MNYIFKILSIINYQLSIVHCLLFIILFSTPAFANDDVEPNNPEDFTKEVLLAIKYDRCQDALNLLLEKERAEDTLSVHHRYLMAEAFSCMGSFKTALDIYSDLLKFDKSNAQYLLRCAEMSELLESWKNGYKYCTQLRQLLAEEYVYCKMCGNISLKAQKYRDAIVFLRCHLEESEDDVEVQYWQALAYYGAKDYTSALLLINACIAADAQESSYYLARARMYEQTGVLKFAADDYSAYLKQNSTDHKAWLEYALLLRKMNRKVESCKAFGQAEAHGNLDAGRYMYRFCR